MTASGLETEVSFFNVLTAIGVLSLTLVIAIAHFSPTVHRSQLWFRHMFSWIVYSASYLLLIGHQFGAPPPFGLCMLQAALIYAAPTFPTLSALCFVVDLYIGLSAVVQNKRKIRPALSRFLLKFPAIVYITVFFVALLCVQDPQVVSRDLSHLDLYCHITTDTPTKVSASIVIGAGLIIVPLEIWIAIILCRHWVQFRCSSHRGQDPEVSLTMFIRVALYTVMSMTAVGLSSTSLGIRVPHPYWTLVLPVVPILAAIAFGTQADIMKCYVFWRETEATLELPVTVSTPKSMDTLVTF